MKSLNLEKNLAHQSKAVDAVIRIFNSVEIESPKDVDKIYANPVFNTSDCFQYVQNIGSIQEENNIKRDVKGQTRILDIMMETGTGKTYTYIKTIFELNKLYGIFKFIIVIPTLSIKAGTINFLKSNSAREHFKEQYGKIISLHIVESKKNGKNKKSYMPSSVNNFVTSGVYDKNKIQVLVINAGMINSRTMEENFDKILLDKYATPFEAIKSTKSFMIIDEPHKFTQENKTWQNIQKMNPQFIIRYGATFKENENLIYKLTAVDSFNKNLVKGVIGYITEFETEQNIMIQFVNSNGTEATFKLIDHNHKKSFRLIKKDSLAQIHRAMNDLLIENLNKTTVILSNGLELKKGDTINPYSYNQTLQETMIQKAIQCHFEQEKKYLTRKIKIKPITLFFIDNIEEYRNKEGYIKITLEKYIKVEVTKLLKIEKDNFYKEYLKRTLEDISKTHAGYFSRDNTEKDEVIEKEINEILHDKQALLSLNNPRRFIFSKWTLREGWDNPNIFQICKLRSSGSDISKLQEVGRGLRLPVNEYGNRVKDEQFFLNYFVDFTESNFVKKLIDEINEKSNAISMEDIPEKLTEPMIKQIVEQYNVLEESLLEELDNKNIITRSNAFKEGGFQYISENYSLIFNGVGSNKIRKSTDNKKKITIRAKHYRELKELWEKLSAKVVLEYKIKNENEFKKLFLDFLTSYTFFSIKGIQERIAKIDIKNNQAVLDEEISITKNNISSITTMRYSEFLKQLSKVLHINLKTLHQCFCETEIEINPYLNQSTIRMFKQQFNNYLTHQAFSKFSIEYQKINSSIHPTKLTNSIGEVKSKMDASDIGVFHAPEEVANNYFFQELFYDSELEKENIKTNIDMVTIFTKIPKNSIKIPIAGGKTYTPDFAYVLDFKKGNQKIYFVVETKNVHDKTLRDEEEQKIKHAENFFDDTVKVKFKTQLSNTKITELIRDILKEYF